MSCASIGGACRSMMVVRTATSSTPRAGSGPSSAANSSGVSSGAICTVPAVVPRGGPGSGFGNQVSRTVPVCVTVASPRPCAESICVWSTTGHASGSAAAAGKLDHSLCACGDRNRRSRHTNRDHAGSYGGCHSATVTAVDLDLTADPVELTAALVDVPSVSGDESALAAAVQAALAAQAPHLRLLRCGNTVLARTDYGHPQRVLLAGHLDTVPIAGNLPSRRSDDLLYGCGTSDMKSGDAMILHLAATVPAALRGLAVVVYDCEGVEAARDG